MRKCPPLPAVRFAAAALAGALLPAAAARAETIVVSKGGAIASIQAGVDAAGAGDTVVVKAGVYQEVVRIDGKDGLTLRASGSVRIEARAAGGAGKGPGIYVTNCDGVTIDGFEVQNAASDAMGSPPGFGIWCTGAGHTVEDCSVRSCTSEGIVVGGADARVEDCAVESCPGGLIVEGNDADVRDCEVHAIIGDGIYVDGDRARVSRVKVTDIDGSGLTISGDFARIEKCKFANTESLGLGIYGSSARAVKNEFIATDSGLYADGDDNVFDRNEFRNCPSEALYSRGDNPTITGNDIDRVSNEYTGIYVDEAATGGRIEDNEIAHSAQEGIGVSSNCNDLVIRKNTVRLCGHAGGPGFRLYGNGHLIELNESLKSGRDGFEVQGNDHVLRKNLAADNGRDGFDIDDVTANNVTLDDNVAKNNAAEGIENNGTNAIITGNVAQKNRIDLANDGTIAAFSGNSFGTGGQAQGPEID